VQDRIDFSQMRSALASISSAVGDGYLVSCAWDGNLMRVCVGKAENDPAEWRKPWVMTFDSEEDYSADASGLVQQLAHGAKAWFGSEKDKADEIERLLKLAASK
jgi:hypothetical protein